MTQLAKSTLPLGIYKMIQVESNGEMPVSIKCSECQHSFETDTPLLEITRSYARIAASCPNCGVAVSVAHLNVVRMQCVPSKDPENI